MEWEGEVVKQQMKGIINESIEFGGKGHGRVVGKSTYDVSKTRTQKFSCIGWPCGAISDHILHYP